MVQNARVCPTFAVRASTRSSRRHPATHLAARETSSLSRYDTTRSVAHRDARERGSRERRTSHRVCVCQRGWRALADARGFLRAKTHTKREELAGGPNAGADRPTVAFHDRSYASDPTLSADAALGCARRSLSKIRASLKSGDHVRVGNNAARRQPRRAQQFSQARNPTVRNTCACSGPRERRVCARAISAPIRFPKL